jgi:hypothetical protein
MCPNLRSDVRRQFSEGAAFWSVGVPVFLLLDPHGRGANVVQDAARTVGFAGFAHASAMENKQVREERPLFFGNYTQEVALYLFGVVVPRQAETARYAPDVSVHDDTLVYREGVAKDHVGGLASHTGEQYQLFHRAGNLSFVLLNEGSSHPLYRAGLVSEEAYGPYLFLQKLEFSLRVVLCGSVLLEESSSDLVDPDIGTLGGEYRGNQKLKRVFPI